MTRFLPRELFAQEQRGSRVPACVEGVYNGDRVNRWDLLVFCLFSTLLVTYEFPTHNLTLQSCQQRLL